MDTGFTAPPPVFLAPFRKSAVLSQRKDRMFQPKNDHHLFHSVTPSIRRTPTPPKRASHGAPRKKREGWVLEGESQSEIEKSMWRRLAWMHLQALLMTADSFLQPRLQSQSSNFIFFSSCAALGQKSSVTLCSLYN